LRLEEKVASEGDFIKKMPNLNIKMGELHLKWMKKVRHTGKIPPGSIKGQSKEIFRGKSLNLHYFVMKQG